MVGIYAGLCLSVWSSMPARTATACGGHGSGGLVHHAYGGCAKSIAAILRRYDLKEAVGEIAARLIEHWEKRGNFQEEAIALAVRRGLSGGISDSVAPF